MHFSMLALQVNKYFEGLLTLEELKCEAVKYHNCFMLSHLLKLDYDEFIEGKKYRVHCDVEPELGLHIFTKYFADHISFREDYNGPLIYCNSAFIYNDKNYVNVAPLCISESNMGKINTSMLKCLELYDNYLFTKIFFLDNPKSPLVTWNKNELIIDRMHPQYDPRLEAYSAEDWRANGLQIMHEIYGDIFPRPSWVKKRALQD